MNYSRAHRFRLAQSYALYYGHGKTDELGEFDVAVVEPAGQKSGDLEAVRKQGTLFIAYISVLEVGPHMPEFSRIGAAEAVRIDGKPAMNETYGTMLVDPRSPKWRRLLFEKAERLLEEEGYDGLFLDTIGDVERPDLPDAVRSALLEACVALVKELRERFPDHLLIQNNGLELLYPETAEYLDGVCWENPPFAQPASQKWIRLIAERLNRLQKRHNLTTLLLIDEEPDLPGVRFGRYVRNFAVKHRFLLYVAPNKHFVDEVGEPIRMFFDKR